VYTVASRGMLRDVFCYSQVLLPSTFWNSQGLDDCPRSCTLLQFLGVLMQGSEISFALVMLAGGGVEGEVEYDQRQPSLCICTALSLPLLRTVDSTISTRRIAFAADIFGISGSAYSASQIAASETDS
jgi:hypothetical protein